VGSYAQWRKGADKGTVRRFTWVCGTELVLVQEVVDTILDLAKARVWIGCSGDSEMSVWVSAGQVSDVDTKVLVVRDAQNMKRWRNLEALLENSRDFRHLYMVFVSSEPGLTKVAGENEDDKAELAPHLAALRDASQGQLVVCSTPSYEDQLAWVKRQVPLSDNLASYLLMKCGGDLSAVRDTCTKIRLLDLTEVSRQAIDDLAPVTPGQDFADCLLSGNKQAAMFALPDDDELASVIGLLDARLDMLDELHKAAALGWSAADMHQRTRLPQFVIAKYRRFAGGYTSLVVQHRRAILAVADAAYRQGARGGVAEAIAALW
jgi:hypothetical protein